MHVLILILHVLGAGVLFSTGIFALLVTTKGKVSKERLLTLNLFEKLAPFAAIWQLITGILLYIYNMQALTNDPLFWTKIVLFVFSGFFAGNIIKRKRINLLKQKGNTVKVGNLPVLLIIEIIVILTMISIGVILIEST